MSKLDIIDAEILRREQSNIDLIRGREDLDAAIEQFNQLDELYRTDEKASRELLECLYLENRHFSGKQPIVYSFALTELYPFYQGSNDANCNPYFPASKVTDGSFDGLTPFPALPTKTGAHARDANFAPTEDVARSPTLTQLNAFPDISNEPLPANFPNAQANIPAHCEDEDNPPQITQPTCEADNGTWIPDTPIPDPVWNGPDTAPALLRVPLTTWKTDIQVIIADLCNDTGSVEEDFWQAIVDDIDIVLATIVSDAVFVRNTGNADPATWGQTQDFTPSSAEDLARDRLIVAADTGVVAHKATRQASLEADASFEEDLFFGIMRLRLHQANGSFAKLQAAKGQKDISIALIEDNESAVESLNILKVKNS